MTVLDDHRQLAAATVAVTAIAAVTLALILAFVGRTSSIPGLLAGAGIGAANAFLLARSLTRYGRRLGGSERAVTSMLMSRFLTIGSLLGLLMAARGLQPVAVVAGFLLFPAGLFVVGAITLLRHRSEAAHAAG